MRYLKECLIRSLHGTEGAVRRWEELRRHDVSDEDLRKAIAYEFGLAGGFLIDNLPVHFVGGRNPCLYIGNRNKPTLHGRALLNAAREVLRIRPYLPRAKNDDPVMEQTTLRGFS